MFPYRSVVIGGGMIGALMDEPGAIPAQTHCGAHNNHNAIDLIAICDPFASDELKKWDRPVYQDIEQMIAEVAFDIATVCVSPDQQVAILKRLLDCDVKLVIAEKPLAPTLVEAEELVTSFACKDIPLLVNFSRRYLSFYHWLADDLSRQNILSVTVRYGKGLAHNGSHALDILHLLLGRVKTSQVLYERNDYNEKDTSKAVFQAYERCDQVFFQVLDQKAYTLFEIDIFTTTNRYIITNDHKDCQIFAVKDVQGVPPGLRLMQTGVKATGHEYALENLMVNAVDVIEGRDVPRCTGENALYVQRLLMSMNHG